jgi:hypothetical protein
MPPTHLLLGETREPRLAENIMAPPPGANKSIANNATVGNWDMYLETLPYGVLRFHDFHVGNNVITNVAACDVGADLLHRAYKGNLLDIRVPESGTASLWFSNPLY